MRNRYRGLIAYIIMTLYDINESFTYEMSDRISGLHSLFRSILILPITGSLAYRNFFDRIPRFT